jgi:hypothetical protein
MLTVPVIEFFVPLVCFFPTFSSLLPTEPTYLDRPNWRRPRRQHPRYNSLCTRHHHSPAPHPLLSPFRGESTQEGGCLSKCARSGVGGGVCG